MMWVDPNNNRRAFLIMAAALAAGLIVFVWLRPSEKQRVHRFIEKGQKAVEARSVIRLEPLIHPQYTDENGFDKATLLAQARQAFQDAEELQVEIREETISLSDDNLTATVDLVVMVTGKINGEAFAGFASKDNAPEKVVLDLEKYKGKEWRLRMARYSGSEN